MRRRDEPQAWLAVIVVLILVGAGCGGEREAASPPTVSPPPEAQDDVATGTVCGAEAGTNFGTDIEVVQAGTSQQYFDNCKTIVGVAAVDTGQSVNDQTAAAHTVLTESGMGNVIQDRNNNVWTCGSLSGTQTVCSVIAMDRDPISFIFERGTKPANEVCGVQKGTSFGTNIEIVEIGSSSFFFDNCKTVVGVAAISAGVNVTDVTALARTKALSGGYGNVIRDRNNNNWTCGALSSGRTACTSIPFDQGIGFVFAERAVL